MKIKLLTAIAVLAMVGAASANILVPNGDFEAGGADWAEGGSFPATGGNGGGYAAVDGGLLVSNSGAPLSLSYFGLGLAPGDTITVEMDMKALSGTSGTGGLKMESWTATGNLTYSTDMNKTITSEWATYSWDYLITTGATHLKFVPLSLSGSNVGFDNVGVVPEPATFGLLGLVSGGIFFTRRIFMV
jgi:hypothetical protein